MKQKLYIYGIVTAMMVFIGVIFKINHWPGAGIILTLGLINLPLVFVPLALADMYKGEDTLKDKSLYYSILVTSLVIFVSMLFKIQHWPYAGILLTIALPFPYLVFLPVFLRVTARNANFRIGNIVAVLALIAYFSVFSALLALNVSKEKLIDSFNISMNYNNVEKAFSKFTGQSGTNPAEVKIGTALKIINEYQAEMLGASGITEEQFISEPWMVEKPDLKYEGGRIIAEKEDQAPGTKLAEAIVDLGAELGRNDDTKAFRDMLFAVADPNEQFWALRTFGENTLSWTLNDLEALESCLLMIR
nr:hypothetical protein [Bacteroidales bacterium]